MDRRTLRRWGGRTLAGAAAVALVAYGAAIAWIKTHESELVFRAGSSHRGLEAALPAGALAVGIPLSGGASLRALELDPPGNSPWWILHFHGSGTSAFTAREIAHTAVLRDRGFHVLAPDYRGFGASAGTPTEAHVYEDAEAAFGWLVARGVDPAHIIVWGHSLGSAPATELVTHHAVAALVLYGGFTSVADRGAELYPWLPVKWIATIGFDNLGAMPRLRAPVLVAHALEDRLVPYRQSQRLFAAAHEPKVLLTLTGYRDDGFGGHLDVLYDQLDRLMPRLAAWLPGFPSPPVAAPATLR